MVSRVCVQIPKTLAKINYRRTPRPTRAETERPTGRARTWPYGNRCTHWREQCWREIHDTRSIKESAVQEDGDPCSPTIWPMSLPIFSNRLISCERHACSCAMRPLCRHRLKHWAHDCNRARPHYGMNEIESSFPHDDNVIRPADIQALQRTGPKHCGDMSAAS